MNKTYHWIAVGLESFEISCAVVCRIARLSSRLPTRIDEICVHDEVVGGPEVGSIASAARACVRCRCADGVC